MISFEYIPLYYQYKTKIMTKKNYYIYRVLLRFEKLGKKYKKIKENVWALYAFPWQNFYS